MFESVLKRIKWIACVAGTLGAALGVQAGVTVEIGDASVAPGETKTVVISLAEYTDASDLLNVSLKIAYDPDTMTVATDDGDAITSYTELNGDITTNQSISPHQVMTSGEAIVVLANLGTLLPADAANGPLFSFDISVAVDAVPGSYTLDLVKDASSVENLNGIVDATFVDGEIAIGATTPTIVDATGTVAEDTAAGTVVHSVEATDPQGDIKASGGYEITAGNSGDVFAIDDSGQITLADPSQLDYETQNQYELEVTVTDDGENTGTGTITISVTETAELHSISGIMIGDAVDGVTVLLTGSEIETKTTTTEGDGSYAFTDLPNGSYTVAPSMTGYVFRPRTTTVTLDGADSPGTDFEVDELTYKLTEGTYSENVNWADAAREEFGPDALVADWQDLKENFKNKADLIAMFDSLGIAKGSGSVAVTNGGKQRWSGGRAYYFAVHEGDVPGHFLVHDHMFDHYVDLGSWPGSRPILVQASASSVPGEEVTAFEDTFANLDQWTLWGSPKPVIYEDKGNPAPSFLNNGDANYDSGAISKKTFDFSNGLVIEGDAYQTDWGLWESFVLGLASKDSYGSSDSASCSVAIRARHDNGDKTQCYIIDENGDREQYEFEDKDTSWRHYKIIIRSDQKVEFYKNENLLYTTQNKLALKHNNKPLILGSRSSSSKVLIDNVRVSKLQGAEQQEEKVALLVPNSQDNLTDVDREFNALMEEAGAVEVLDAADIKNGDVDLSTFGTIACFTYGNTTAVEAFDQTVADAVLTAVEGGTAFVTNGEAGGAKILSLAGLVEAKTQSGWYPALRDSRFYTAVPEDDRLFEGIEPETVDDPQSKDVSFWTKGEHSGLVFRVDNRRSYTGRYGIGQYITDPDGWLTEGFSTGWSVSTTSKRTPFWTVGAGRIVRCDQLRWTFDQDAQKGGYIGPAGRQLLANIGKGYAHLGGAVTSSGLEENFDDGDFTANPEWMLYNDDDKPAQVIEVVDGALHIKRTGAGGNGGHAGIRIATDIPVTERTELGIDVRPVSRDVGDGYGWKGHEYPINAELLLELDSGSEVSLHYAFNYGSAVMDKEGSDFKQYAFSVPQDQWTRNLSYRIHDAWPTATRIKRVSVLAAGWNYESYADNIRIHEGTGHMVLFDLGEHADEYTGGGELIQNVSHGQGANAPEFAVERGWMFSGWSESFDNVTEDLFVIAEYEELAIEQPDWQVPGDMQNTMTVYARIQMSDGTFVDADGSMLSVWKGDEVRGVATVIDGPTGRLFQLAVGSNAAEEEGLSFKVFDAETGEITEIPGTFDFVADTPLGSIADPFIPSRGLEIELAQGWNWISINCTPSDSSVGTVLSEFAASDEDMVKSSTGTTTYYGEQWWAADFEVIPGRMYLLRKASPDTESILVQGVPLDGTEPIPVSSGWNWLGYTAAREQGLDCLQHAISFNNDDMIKSNTATATYYDGQWWGDLALLPGKGYKMRCTEGGSVTFDGTASRGTTTISKVATRGDSRSAPNWDSSSLNFQNTMTIYAQVVDPQGNLVEVDGSQLAAFKDDELRGVGTIGPGPGGKLFQLAVGSNESSEDGLSLKVYDAQTDEVLPVAGIIEFNADSPIGGIASPVEYEAEDPNNPDTGWSFSFTVTGATNEELVFGMAEGATVDLDDVDQDVAMPPPGKAGAYFYRFEPAEMSFQTDIIGTAESGEWFLVVQADADAPVDLSWRSSGTTNFPDGKYLTMYEVDADHLPMGATARNMMATQERTIDAGETAFLVIRFADTLLADIALRPAWNLISLPLQPVTTEVSDVFDDANVETGAERGTVLRDGMRGKIYSGEVWTYVDGDYQAVAELAPLVGYWVYAESAATFLIEGQPVESGELPLSSGWNLRGPAVPVAVPDNPHLRGSAWWWDADSQTYQTAEELLPCRGYWLNARQETTLFSTEDER